MAAESTAYPAPTHDQRAVDYTFTPAEITEIQKHVAKYPDKMSAVMPALWIAQEKFGVLSTGAIQLVADTLGLSFAHVFGVASFYTMYLKQGVPAEKFHLVEVCTCFTCGECGGRELYAYAQKMLNTDASGMSADKRFYLREAECLGACDTPNVVQVDNRRLCFNVTEQKLASIVEGLKADRQPAFESVPVREVGK